MDYRRNRQVAGILIVGLLILVAGCSDIGGSATATPEPDEPDEAATEADGRAEETMADSEMTETMAESEMTETAMESTEGDDGGSEQAELPTYRFSEGESYTYESTFGDTTTTETWAVMSVNGDELTVERLTESDGETETQTVSGTHSSIYDEVSADRTINFFAVARGVTGYGLQGELTPGNTFTVQSNSENTEWETATVEVQGERTVNGIDCVEYTVTPDGVDQQWTICQADGYPFALSLSWSQGGQAVLEMTLTDATRP